MISLTMFEFGKCLSVIALKAIPVRANAAYDPLSKMIICKIK